MNRYDDNPDQTPEERHARHHRVLHRLTDLCMGEAEGLAVDTVSPPVEKAVAMARVARAVRTTIAIDARLDDWAIARERKRRALAAEAAAEVKRDHIRKTKRRVVMAFRDIVERGADREYLKLAENLMDGERYDEELFELPFTEALAIVANDLGGNVDRTTFGKPRPAETKTYAPADDFSADDLSPADFTPENDPMRGANASTIRRPRPNAPPATAWATIRRRFSIYRRPLNTVIYGGGAVGSQRVKRLLGAPFRPAPP